MDTFDTAKKKIYDVNTKIDTNASLLQKKENDSKDISLEIEIFKKTRVISDTGNIPITPDTSSFSTTDENAFVPLVYNYSYANTFNVPERMLPFIDFQSSFLVGSAEESYKSGLKFESDYWVYNYIEVFGGGSQIWQGFDPPTFDYGRISYGTLGNQLLMPQIYKDMLVTKAQIDAQNIPTALTEEAWHINVEFPGYPSEGGGQKRIRNGLLVAFLSQSYEIIPNTCGDNSDYKFLVGSVYHDSNLIYYGTNYPVGKIVNISGNSVTVTGTEFHVYWRLRQSPYGCYSTVERTENVTKTFDLYSGFVALVLAGDMERYDTVKEKWYRQSLYGYRGLNYNGFSNFRAWKNNDFYPYYETQKRFLFAVYDPNGKDKVYYPQLIHTPWNTIHNYPLPYSTMQFNVNVPDEYPIKKSELNNGTKTETFVGPEVLQSDPVWVRISKSTDSKESWQVLFEVNTVGLKKANQTSNDDEYLFNRDYYIHNNTDTEYIKGEQNHDVKVKKTFTIQADKATTNMQIIASLRNPLYWKENKHFNKETS